MDAQDANDACIVGNGGKGYLNFNFLTNTKCVYESLDRPCKLCEKLKIPCGVAEKVLGPKTQSKPKDSEWIDPQTGHVVLSVNGNFSSDKLYSFQESKSDQQKPSMSADQDTDDFKSFFPVTTTCDEYREPPIHKREANRAFLYYKFLSQVLPKSPQSFVSESAFPQHLLNSVPPSAPEIPAQLSIQPPSISMGYENVAIFDPSKPLGKPGIVSIDPPNYSQPSHTKSPPTACFPCACASCAVGNPCWFASHKPDNGSSSLNEATIPRFLADGKKPTTFSGESRLTDEFAMEVQRPYILESLHTEQIDRNRAA